MRPQEPAPSEFPQEVRPALSPPGPAGPLDLAFIATPAAASAARAAVSAWMTGHVTDAMLVDVRLVVGELVANSVVHADVPAGAVISIHARVVGEMLRLEVGDGGTGGTVQTRAPDLADGGGFGLNVVAMLSRRWGVDRNGGTNVWAELAFRPAG